VRVESQYNGETADVELVCFVASNGFDREDTVGTYHMSLNEPRMIPELKSFGVEPFKII
jgi:hypothetical protein